MHHYVTSGVAGIFQRYARFSVRSLKFETGSEESLFGFRTYEAISLCVIYVKLELGRPTEDQSVNCFSVAMRT